MERERERERCCFFHPSRRAASERPFPVQLKFERISVHFCRGAVCAPMALTAELQAEHLSAPQAFILRPSAAAENVFARIQQARLNHEPPNTSSSRAPLSSDGQISKPPTADGSASPVLSLSGEGASPGSCSPPLLQSSGNKSEAQPVALAVSRKHNPMLQPLALHSLPSPPSPLSSPSTLGGTSGCSQVGTQSLPPPRTVLHLPLGQPMLSRSMSPASSPPASPTGKVVSPKRQPRPSETARRMRGPRAMHRSVSPDSNQKVERKSRPNSIGSSSSEVSAIQQVRDTLPLQLAISPRREQSALVSEMVVAESGGALAGGSVKALLEVRLSVSHFHSIDDSHLVSVHFYSGQ